MWTDLPACSSIILVMKTSLIFHAVLDALKSDTKGSKLLSVNELKPYAVFFDM